jgi:hypothetical protein
MDPLSIAANIIAVVQISSSVLIGCYRLHGQVRESRNEISRLIDEVSGLGEALNDLHEILQNTNDKA